VGASLCVCVVYMCGVCECPSTALARRPQRATGPERPDSPSAHQPASLPAYQSTRPAAAPAHRPANNSMAAAWPQPRGRGWRCGSGGGVEGSGGAGWRDEANGANGTKAPASLLISNMYPIPAIPVIQVSAPVSTPVTASGAEPTRCYSPLLATQHPLKHHTRRSGSLAHRSAIHGNSGRIDVGKSNTTSRDVNNAPQPACPGIGAVSLKRRVRRRM